MDTMFTPTTNAADSVIALPVFARLVWSATANTAVVCSFPDGRYPNIHGQEPLATRLHPRLATYSTSEIGFLHRLPQSMPPVLFDVAVDLGNPPLCSIATAACGFPPAAVKDNPETTPRTRDAYLPQYIVLASHKNRVLTAHSLGSDGLAHCQHNEPCTVSSRGVPAAESDEVCAGCRRPKASFVSYTQRSVVLRRAAVGGQKWLAVFKAG
ncbi:hypothetical protein GE09DRAFT_482822 [Coniochaeta sp. 2T2.1]|nr:hypothetical protein GE09DRAFT_482822 [Coniochaeta sp. 2T2.1]